MPTVNTSVMNMSDAGRGMRRLAGPVGNIGPLNLKNRVTICLRLVPLRRADLVQR